MEELVTKEIEEVHVFFEQWFKGVLPNSDESFNRLASVFSKSFSFVPPSGQELAGDIILSQIKGAWGSNREISIMIEEVKVLTQNQELVVARYVERQTTGNRHTARLSTAVFKINKSLPNQLEWLTVHETWQHQQ
ncbi:MAG: hypothetical protein AAFX87_24380 [Bacteroidota bacterium]